MSADPRPADPSASAPTPARPPGILAAISSVTGDAFGLGIALVVLPSVALYFGVERFAPNATIGLPMTAIFGIMILFGALSLVGTLYARLNLADPKQALGLPEGSMRAFMALSLIVLFAIISIMVYRSMMEPFKISGLTPAEREALVSKVGDRVLGIVDEGCVEGAVVTTASISAASAAPATSQSSGAVASVGAMQKRSCAEADHRFTLLVRPPPDPASTDLAKQLLILVGTLMTSVTSFYFAARTATPSGTKTDEQRQAPVPNPTPTPAPAPNPALMQTVATVDADAHADGCNVDAVDATPDEDLPPARGGVAP